jgi:DNA-binding winged helix-turn-helix (wHTH) protein/tetratricopeptide (TPR) repeat protein/TolB-like protein
MNSDLFQGFYLGDFLVDPRKGQVAGRDGSAHLPPKAMEALLCIASNPGNLVTREELIEAVWGEGHGSAETLSHAVSEIRHALDDHREDPKYIQTLPKRGYRLLVDVTPVSAHTSSVVLGAHGSAAVQDIGLFENLNRRGVLETALAYLIVGWLLIQIADIVFSQLHLPPWIGTFVTVLVIAGFPIAVLLSWFLEFRDGRATPHELAPKVSLQRRFSRTYLSVLGALAIASVVVFTYDNFVGLPQADIAEDNVVVTESVLDPIDDLSIAVLPFLNLDKSERTQLFSVGLADDLINGLYRVPGLSVPSRGDSFMLDPNTASAIVRERLRVALYIEGSIEMTDDEMRVTAQLIDSKTGFHKFSRTFTIEIGGFFEMRDELTNLVISIVQVTLPPETQLFPFADNHASSLTTYMLYRQGREIYEQPKTLESLAIVLDYYQQALAKDSQYAAAHAGICDVYVARYELSNVAADIKSAEQACGTALASNHRLDMVHAALGSLYARTGRIEDAEYSYDRALSLNPKNARAMGGLANVFRKQQKYVEAEALLHTAIATQPGNTRLIYRLGSFLFTVGRYSDAADEFRKVVLMDKEFFQARTSLASALTMAGDFAAGKLVYEESIDIRPSPTAYSNLGVIYYYLGEFENSIQTHRKAIEMSPKAAISWLNLADALYFAGEGAEAEKAFRRAAELAESRIAIDPTDIDNLFTLAWAQQMVGDGQKAQWTVLQGLKISPNDSYGLYYDALIKVQSGEHQLALISLDRALVNGYPANMLVAEPYLNDLHANTEFQEIISRND